MSIVSGPKVSDEGLVLHYDMSNIKKSFKGKPTINDISGGSARALGQTAPLNIVRHIGTYNTAPTTSGTKTVYQIENVSAGATDYIEMTQGFTNTNISGNSYSYSFEYKFIDGTAALTSGATVYGDGYKQPDASNYSTNQVITDEYIGDGWYRRKLTYTATYTGINRIRFNFNVIDSKPFTVQVTNFQLEESEFVTPFVADTRSNTESIIDLTGDNTFVINDLLYNSDNTFQFDGINDRVTITTPSPLVTDRITLEAWVYPTQSAGESNPSRSRGCAIGGQSTMYLGIIQKTGQQESAMHFAIKNTSGTRPSVLTGVVPTNEWSHLVGVYDGSNIIGYLNGEAISSPALTGLIDAGTTYWIGTYQGLTDSNHNFPGIIETAKIYNRALTADEVRDNFEARRSRFGI